jgi:hypothetical protein
LPQGEGLMVVPAAPAAQSSNRQQGLQWSTHVAGTRQGPCQWDPPVRGDPLACAEVSRGALARTLGRAQVGRVAVQASGTGHGRRRAKGTVVARRAGGSGGVGGAYTTEVAAWGQRTPRCQTQEQAEQRYLMCVPKPRSGTRPPPPPHTHSPTPLHLHTYPGLQGPEHAEEDWPGVEA